MAFWGKLLGGSLGFIFGGPLGLLLGGLLGHGLDRGLARLIEGKTLDPRERERVQHAFFTTTFSVMGHLAKADGRVSEREIALAEAVIAQMRLSPARRSVAIRLFQEGKAKTFDLDGTLKEFKRLCFRHPALIQMFLEIQIQAAYADGPPHPAEEKMLRHICQVLGIPEWLYRHLEQWVRQSMGAAAEATQSGPSLEDAYQILGIQPQASDAEVKRAYRRLLSQHHPDKLVSKGLPEEMMQLAAQKIHEIRQAYERILQARGK